MCLDNDVASKEMIKKIPNYNYNNVKYHTPKDKKCKDYNELLNKYKREIEINDREIESIDYDCDVDIYNYLITKREKFDFNVEE